MGRAEAPHPETWSAHLSEVARRALDALGSGSGAAAAGGDRPFGGWVFHAGGARTYPRDDLAIPFRTDAHFARFVPVPGPDHLLVLRPGPSVRLVRVSPRDFWTEPAEAWPHPWTERVDTREVTSIQEAVEAAGDVSDCAFAGSDTDLARALAIAPDGVEPPTAMARLDWERAVKTPYEIDCHRVAAQRASAGHAAARDAALAGAPERVIHAAYLEASGQLEGETPYPNIIAWDDRAAVLHYGSKRTTAPGRGALLLIDAGATAWGYASDITRTHLTATAPPLLRELLAGMEALQRGLVGSIAPGVQFEEVHARALRGVASLLETSGILRIGADEAVQRGIASAFMPHGVGHLLGLQVHDVGGLQASPDGGVRAPGPGCERLRNTRTCAPGQVVTIEPGLYFVPMLLELLRSEPRRGGDAIDWEVVDALLPFGGIRIEDDVCVTSDGREDLSRPFVPPGAGPERQ